ncbi:helix-turn-helix domain-containing protein [Leptospira wolffii]|uniref:helix-turn-helix domain-containing protein n=1 Tax=Leptospira wolffii TaxID=409998 RepID=UPI0002F6223B|nr:helix-turn-helix transcriptional regulator [Leptospira wolffii]EPG64635.1 DNA-binding helix-turn-helix protein [Leptospira wolffii serovar Khorat str. Khorat-H2]
MDYESFQKNVSKRIKQLRLDKKLSQEELTGLDMGVRVYQRIESGDGAPSLQSLYKIAKALGVHPKELLNIPMPEERAKKAK